MTYEEDQHDEVKWAKSTRRFLFATTLIGFVCLGIFTAVVREGEEPQVPFLLLLLLAILVSSWCLMDGKVRGRSAVSIALMGVFVFWPLGLPAYLLWSRGLRGLFTLVGFSALAVLAMMIGGLETLAVRGFP